jgi:hypothetical protein
MISRLASVCRAFTVLLIAGALAAPVANSFAQQATPTRSQSTDSPILTLHEDNLLVLEVRLDRRSTGHGLIAYQHEDRVLLPLGELCSILELAIMVDPELGSASGWIVDEDRTFELNLSARTITRTGNIEPLPPSIVGRDENDIFVDSSHLEQWIPVDLELNLPRMHVKITPRETLPFQSRLKRDEQRSLWLASQGNATLNYPMQMAPYRMWSWPLVEATLGLFAGRQNTSRRLALQSSADVAGLSSNLFLSHAGNSVRSQTVARLKAGRWNPEGRLLGPASATRYEFGDIFISRVPLISTRQQGLGFTISNQSLSRSREFDTTDVHGDAPPGWEAELYINGSLYDFQTVPESGQYLFTDLPLVVGNNVFRTVLYGPRGETREIVDNSNISAEMSEIGKLKYSATIVKEGKGLLAATPTRADSLANAWNQQIELAYAVSPKHALAANFSRLNVEGLQEFFASLTSHNSLGRLYLETILAKSMRGGVAGSIGARAKYHGHNLFALHNVNDNYRAEALIDRSYMRRQTILRSSGNLASIGERAVFYNLSATDRYFADRALQKEMELKFHLSTSIRRYLLSHSIRYLDKDYGTYKDEETLGTQLIRTQLGAFSIRGDLNYEVSPLQMRSTGASLSWFHTNRLRVSARASHFLKPDFGNDNMSADLTQFFEKFSLGVNYSYFKGGGSAIGVTLGTFLTKDNRSNTWAVQHRRMANRAVASVRTFIDYNSNKVFDEGDEPLAGVGFRNLSAWQKIKTNEDGIALLPGLLVHRAQPIELNLSTVDDPFLVPLSKGVNVLGHPGSFVEVEFPFSYLGELEGLITESDESHTPVRHVGLEILDLDGSRVKSTVGEFDGFYYFADIFPGEYLLGVIPTTVNSTRFEIPDPVPFTIPPEGGFITGPDIVLQRKAIVETEAPVIASLPPVHSVDEKSVPEKFEVPVPQIADPEPRATEPEAQRADPDVLAADPEPQTSDPEPQPTSPAAPPRTDVAATPPVVVASNPGGAGSGTTGPGSVQTEPAALAPEGEYDEELTLSLIFEILYRNSLWPDDAVQ